MYVYKNYKDAKENLPYSVALGSFDGLHLGHQSIIKSLVEKSKNNTTKSLVYTFDEHPRKSLNREAKIELLTQNSIRLKIFESLDVDTVFLDDFNKIRHMEPEEFIKEILVDVFHIKYATVGYNYHFGKYSSGDAKILRNLGEKYNFEVKIFEPIKIDNNVVSSTLIRNLIVNGKIDAIKKYLGRYYSIGGIVIPGKQNGRKIGINTANLILPENSLVPLNGVYMSNVLIEGNLFKGITNIGRNPTFKADIITVETHILNFNSDIYGKEIELELLQWIRPEKAFSSIDALKEQIQVDIGIRKSYNSEK